MAPSVKVRKLGLYVLAILFVLNALELLGVFRYMQELDYPTQFAWPLEIPDFRNVILRYSKGEKIEHRPINTLYQDIRFTESPMNRCDQELQLLVLIKSAPTHFEQRRVIRNTWGFEHRFSDVPVKVVFMLGQLNKQGEAQLSRELQVVEDDIVQEISIHNDILRADFIDSYYNLTYKTMTGMRWAVEECNKSPFVFFVDDDMYVSMKNLLLFLQNPFEYPDYLEDAANSRGNVPEAANFGNEKLGQYLPGGRNRNYSLNHNLRLYAGYVLYNKPLRSHLSPRRKYYVELSEWPFSYYPRFAQGGAAVWSRSAMIEVYYASMFIQEFPFEDVYMGICARKMGIEPYHSAYFKYWLTETYDPKYVISAREYSNGQDLLNFWNVQKQSGNA